MTASSNVEQFNIELTKRGAKARSRKKRLRLRVAAVSKEPWSFGGLKSFEVGNQRYVLAVLELWSVDSWARPREETCSPLQAGLGLKQRCKCYSLSIYWSNSLIEVRVETSVLGFRSRAF
jgi:hypothetical protein